MHNINVFVSSLPEIYGPFHTDNISESLSPFFPDCNAVLHNNLQCTFSPRRLLLPTFTVQKYTHMNFAWRTLGSRHPFVLPTN